MVVGFAGVALAATGEIAGPAFNDIAGHEAEGELTLMAALGVMNGDSGIGGPVRPDDGITRAEFAKMIVAGLGKSSTAAGLAGLVPTFKDQIPSWAWGWVNAAYFMGLMKGDDQGKFRPADPVTYAEVMTVMVRMVRGHEQQIPAGIWPYNYLFYGVDEGFNGPVDMGAPRLPATRGDVARILLATMQIDRLDKDGKPVDGSAMLAGRVFEGLFTAYSATQVTIDGTLRNLADKVYVVGATDYEGLMNLNVRAVANASGKIIFLQVIEAANTYRGTFADLLDKDSSVAGKDTLKFADGTEIRYAGHVSVNLNKADAYDDDGNPDTAPVAFNETDLAEGDECVVTLNADGKAAHIVASRFDVAEDYVTDVTKSTGGAHPTDTAIELDGGATYTIPAAARVTINGTLANRDDLAEFDVVYTATKAAQGDEVIAVKAVRQVVQGTVKSTSTSYPGPKYFVTIEKTSGTSSYRWNPAKLGTDLPGAGTVVKIGLNEAGELYAPIGFTTATPYVLVTAYTVDGAGHKSVTVDSRGQTVTYPTTVDFRTLIGKFGEATIDGATNTVTGFAEAAILSSPVYDVLAVDAAHGTMTVKNLTSGAILFVNDPDVTIYKSTSSGYAFVGFAGISVGDDLTADAGRMIWVVSD